MRSDTRRGEPAETSGAHPGLRWLYGAAIALALSLALLHGTRLIASIDSATWPLAVAGSLAGILLADLASGLVHWACDSWGNEQTRWLGPGLIRAFREHHRDPQAMVQHGWIEVNREAAAVAALAFALLLLIDSPAALGEHPFRYALLFTLIGLSGVTNQLHQWAHARKPPAPIRQLQRLRLLLPRSHHAGHHRAPHTRRYCISTGWLNPLLDGMRFWRGLERAVRYVTGAEPRADPRRRSA